MTPSRSRRSRPEEASAVRPPRGGIPDWVAPQLATLAAAAPAGEEWLHEIKYDGYRLLAWVDGRSVRLVTRNRKDWTDRFPAIVHALAGLGLRGALLDGEAAVEVAGGITSFQALQNVQAAEAAGGRLRYWVFDLLFLAGRDLRGLPLSERKALLDRNLADAADPVRYSDHVVGRGPAFLASACRHGLEGIICKRADAAHRSGRGGDWLKVKCLREQEFVIGGFTEPGGARKGLGALHVGTFQDDELVYRGKVGTGFSDAALRDLRRRLRPLQRPDSPFVDGPRGAASRSTHWVEPTLVAQVRYTEITTDGRLRHPSFRGLREDKDARSVGLESAPPTPVGPPEDASKQSQVSGGNSKGGNDMERATVSPARAKGAGSPVRPGGVRLSNPDRVLYASAGVTKRDLAAYYEQVAEWMLPHIARRPLTLVRCPAGQEGHCFFQKHFDDPAPAGISRVLIEERDGPEWYGTLNSVRGLVSLVQLGALELHTWNSRADRLERPDRFIIDLDPDPGVGWDAVIDGALHVRDLLEELGLRSFLKTTGGKGLHVAVPLLRRADWSEVKEFSRAVASLLARAAPGLYTTELSKRKRHGRILLDYLRNARGATAIEAYSTRARPGATVAAPIHWDELADGVRPDTFTVANMPARMRELGDDPWKEIGAVKQSLTAPMRRRLGL
jgi:bifunctional non-homologous end joining protein LigD